ncbi:MJ0042 family finger-like domain-containing protein [Tistlia consotensis]|uniref:MJ0042 family finger-like domain-containing protein n=1 Tax=Tistlia consotensis USBA 355 TaxID=560819 RepID=A0A1Y6B4I8_9PROT|nr:DUF3426 domain-containing protein [Tistlia consotensis]SME91624.1 MJ0042 family finger-like domain-containing protein [Tistlia consotensis USBA 355]SNR27499.1 MJ0042 family finger-like domain-containing protein [Tistlia consotensis]
MEIACPNCAKRFRVPTEKLAPNGRKVRCAACGHVWHQPAPEGAAPAQPAPGPAAAPPAPARPAAPKPAAAESAEQWPRDPHRAEPAYDRPPIFDEPHFGEPRRFELAGDGDYARLSRGRSRVVLLLGWLLLLLVVAALLGGGWYYRNQVVATVPELQQIYDLLGVPLENGHPGVALRDVTTQLNTVDGSRVMTITGSVVNIGDEERKVPLLVATVTDKTGAVLVEWRFEAGKALLAPGEKVAFETKREAIPRGELSVRVDFVLH